MVNAPERSDAICDVVIVGGGVAGLWTLRHLMSAGYSALLCERTAFGHGQSVQAQGIVHGGGKYALRSVGDVAAIRAIREMPDRWRTHLAGKAEPSLAAATCLRDCCWLWLPKGSFRARLEAITLMPFLRHGGVLACPPMKRPKSEWPDPLQSFAQAAYRMDEPVLDTRSVLAALAEPARDHTLQASVVRTERDEVHGTWNLGLNAGGRRTEVRARSVVLTAGAGNEDLLELFGVDGVRMQRRPLRMALLRGDLPSLHGHCVVGGKTRATITSFETAPGEHVWQIGGEVAERNAPAMDQTEFYRDVIAELIAVLPGLDLSNLEISGYDAVRAEGANAEQRRPSGVQVETPAKGLCVAWPTKWAMAPIVAAEIAASIEAPSLGSSADLSSFADWPRPQVAAFPWEGVQWTRVDSVARD